MTLILLLVALHIRTTVTRPLFVLSVCLHSTRSIHWRYTALHFVQLHCLFACLRADHQPNSCLLFQSKPTTMGRVFLKHIGGQRLYICSTCETPLTNRSQLLSTRFTGSTGRAFLFNDVVNLSYSEVQDRVMLTGRHMVRDVSCKNCDTKLGWFYEFATQDNQRYKEGKVILERALVNEIEGFTENND